MNGIIGVCNEIMTILKHFPGLNKIKKSNWVFFFTKKYDKYILKNFAGTFHDA